MTKLNKYKLLSYIILAVIYLVLTTQILVTFHAAFDSLRLGGFAWLYGSLALVAAFVNSMILFLVSKTTAFNLSATLGNLSPQSLRL